ncbi:hypothetical protein L6164_025768 [Bauhinia variegata]|uniref:Uncharacterized protein n=1 Tax=Bauhinia variegata TaxID=167791 RepID=A0ACB9M1I8_BAUVA|nr:hypothetical protein L6164_025768 [Bauhinia variegata]
MAHTTKLSLKSLLHFGESEHNPLTLSDEQILDQIYSTHVHDHTDTKLDVNSLFTLVENILKRSTHIVDNVVQGGSHASLEQFDNKIVQTSFTSPLCLLKKISSELSCKPAGEEVAHKTTLAILDKLSNYSWDAKAILTLAAFALEYGEFWLLSQLQPTDLLARSLAVLKRVPVLTKPAALQKYRQAITEFNSLIKSTLQVIELIFELEKLTVYDTNEVPALTPAIEQIPVDVYWAIITVAAIATQIDALTTDSEHKQDLSHFGQKINITLSKLRKHITLTKQQIAEVEYYRKLRKVFQTPTEIMEVFKLLISSVDVPQAIYDGATKTTVNIDVLKRKNVYLFISTLDITEEEIAVMAWYVVQYFGAIAGFKFIKEEWYFKKKPMVVVLNPQGKVQHKNAFHFIEVWGLKGFPFTTLDQERIDREVNWVGPAVSCIHPTVDAWIKEEKYIFFYGGNDKDWIQQFTKYASALKEAVLKESKISIELFHVNKEDKSLFSRFWSGIESLFVTKLHKTVDIVTQQVQRMLSYKNETGWALLSKGSTVVVSGHGTTILETVAEFDKWRETLINKGFELSFKEYHKLARPPHRCSHLEIHNVAGKLPETIKCPDCPRTMEIFFSYKCCHNHESTGNANH